MVNKYKQLCYILDNVSCSIAAYETPMSGKPFKDKSKKDKKENDESEIIDSRT